MSSRASRSLAALEYHLLFSFVFLVSLVCLSSNIVFGCVVCIFDIFTHYADQGGLELACLQPWKITKPFCKPRAARNPLGLHSVSNYNRCKHVNKDKEFGAQTHQTDKTCKSKSMLGDLTWLLVSQLEAHLVCIVRQNTSNINSTNSYQGVAAQTCQTYQTYKFK